MTTKRTASKRLKAEPKAPTVKPEFEPLEELFEKAHKIMLLKLETQIELSRRVDNLMSVRDSAYKFWGNMLDEKYFMTERVAYFKQIQDITTNTYKKLYEIAQEFSLEEFKKKDMKDYFSDVLPKVEDIESEEQLLEAALIFQCVQPYGSQMNQIHQMIIEEIDKRKAYESLD